LILRTGAPFTRLLAAGELNAGDLDFIDDTANEARTTVRDFLEQHPVE
jgi:hypothetical protein